MIYVCGDNERFDRLEDAVSHAIAWIGKAGRFIHIEHELEEYKIRWREQTYIVLSRSAEDAVRIFFKQLDGEGVRT